MKVLHSTHSPSRAAVALSRVAATPASASLMPVSSDAIGKAVERLLAAPTVLGAIHAADRLRHVVRHAPRGGSRAAAWPDPLDPGLDAPSVYGLLHALAELPGGESEDVLVRAMRHPDPGIREHAVWAMGRRSPMEGQIEPLIQLVGKGGFVSMLAGLTLQAWASATRVEMGSGILPRLHRSVLRAPTPQARRRLADLATLVGAPRSPDSVPEREPHPTDGPGSRIVQLLLYGHLDAGLRDAGAGDGGGLVTLLVTLARALGRRSDVGSVVTIARRRSGDPAGPETLAHRATLERIDFGDDTPLSIGAAWEHWPTIERGLDRLLRRFGRVDAIHLRLGDVGSMAASRVARRLGIPVVFTLAPDPHGVIRAAERAGTLSRASFGAFDLAQHAWFRARLVTALATEADSLVLFPRPGGSDELAELLDMPIDGGRVTVVPEGIDLRQARSARAGAMRSEHPQIIRELSARIGSGPPGRDCLPLLVSAARFHPVKGLDRLVAAWLGEPELRDRYNLVLAGGSLQDGTVEELRTLATIEAAGVTAGYSGTIPGLYLLGSISNSEVAGLLAAASVGVAPHIGPGGVYVCSSAKEEFGLSVVEALAAGLPVVAPDGGGPRTYIAHGRTGILADTTSVPALARATLAAADLWHDPGRAALVESQVATMSIEGMAAQLAQVYRAVAAPQEAVG